MAHTISGVVLDGEGIPVDGATVFVGPPDPRRGGESLSTRTDSQGRFRGTLPTGFYVLTVSKPGYESVNRPPVSISEDTTFDLTLRVGIRLIGKVNEVDVGPLDDATVEVISGPSAGLSALTGHPVPGQFLLDHVLPGEFTLRASKAGYDPVEQIVRAVADVGNLTFSLKWAYGTCLQSVTPVVFDPYPSTGGTETVMVNANAARRWTATPESWMELVSPTSQTGSGRVTFRVLANPAGSTLPRRGALMIRCSATEGQNVWVNQNPGCQVHLESAPDSPAVFDPSGGVGHLFLHVEPSACHWQFTSRSDWIHTSGISQWSGDLPPGVFFAVAPNTTGMTRVGTVVVGETPWQVTQQ